jgi:hypothetical protein
MPNHGHIQFVCTFEAGEHLPFKGSFNFDKGTSWTEFLKLLEDNLGVIGTSQFRFVDEDYGERPVRNATDYAALVLYTEHTFDRVGFVAIKIE